MEKNNIDVKQYLDLFELDNTKKINLKILKKQYKKIYKKYLLNMSKLNINNDITLIELNKAYNVLKNNIDYINDHIEQKENNSHKILNNKKIILILVLIVMIIVSSIIIPIKITNDKIDYAIELLENEKYDEAKEILQKINNKRANLVLDQVYIYKFLNNGIYYVVRELFMYNFGEVEIKYNPRGGQINKNEKYLGSFYKCEKKGYTFEDYVLSNYKMKDNKLTLYLDAKYNANIYKIEYELNEGINDPNNPTSYTCDNDNITILPPKKTGHKFEGWLVDGEIYSSYTIDTKLAKDIKLVAYFTIEEITIEFETDNGNYIEAIKTHEGQDVKLPTPAKVGYIFVGWYNGDELVENGVWKYNTDVTLFARWEQTIYKITLKHFNDTEMVSEIIEVKHKETFELPTPVRENYIFIGWFEGKQEFKSGIFEYTHDVVLLAKWEGKKFNITFDAQGGVLSSDDIYEVTYGESFVLPIPKKTDYVFKGWYYNEKIVEEGKWTIPNNVTLVANWIKDENIIVYNLDGGENHPQNPVTYETQTQDIKIYKPQKLGHIFLGWITDSILEPIENYVIKKNTKGIIELTAVWRQETYKLIYMNDKSSDYNYYRYGDVITYTAYIKKQGYEVDYWVDKDGNLFNHEKFLFEHDVTIYPVWKPKQYEIEYDLQGGSLPLTSLKYFTYNEEYILPIPQREGYRFGGWYYNEDRILNGTWEIDETKNLPIKLEATWVDLNTFVIYYYMNGARNYNPEHHILGQDTVIKNPSKSGRIFLGWKVNNQEQLVKDLVISKDTAEDIVLEAIWEEIMYTVIYDVNGGDPIENPIENLPHGAYLPKPKVFRKGYTFQGWFDEEGKHIDEYYSVYGNYTFVAKWISNIYTVTYDVNGGNELLETIQKIRFDEEYQLAQPTRQGYEFKGWYYNDQLIVDGVWNTIANMTLVAKWEESDNVEYRVYHYFEKIEDENYVLRYTERFYGVSNSFVTPEVKNVEGFTSPIVINSQISPDGSTVIEYFYKRNEYTITLISNVGRPLEPLIFKYEEPIVLPTPMKEGYIFLGWYEDESQTNPHKAKEMGLKDYTIYAKWVKQ